MTTSEVDAAVGTEKTVANAQGMLLSWWAARVPNRPALITPHGDRTFGELNANINRLARALRSRGLKFGDSVALMCTKRPEFIEVLRRPSGPVCA